MTKNSLLIVPLDLQGQAPEWIRIVPLGKTELRDSRPPFEATRADLEALIAAFRAEGVRLVIDYEHKTLTGDKAPAAGWITDLEIRDDGLWARVDWTSEARQEIADKKYGYYSPVLKLNPETRRVEKLMHAGLTNVPAIKGVAPLLAAKYGEDGEPEILVLAAVPDATAAQATRAKKYGIAVKDGGNVTKPGQWAQVPDEQFADPVNYRYPMPDHDQCQAAWGYWNHSKNQEQYSPEERAIITRRITARAKEVGMKIAQEAKPMKNKLVGLLALKAEATDDEVFTALESRLNLADSLPEIAVALGLEKEADVAKITGTILALKQGSEQLTTLQTELESLKAEHVQGKAQKAVDEALAVRKITPAQTEWALKYATENPEGFAAYVKAAAPVLAGTELKVPAGDKTPGGVLDKEEQIICTQLNLQPEAYLAAKQAQAQ